MVGRNEGGKADAVNGSVRFCTGGAAGGAVVVGVGTGAAAEVAATSAAGFSGAGEQADSVSKAASDNVEIVVQFIGLG